MTNFGYKRPRHFTSLFVGKKPTILAPGLSPGSVTISVNNTEP